MDLPMKTAAAYDAERIRAQYEHLSRHYRAIGPAALLAALLFVPRQRPRAYAGR
jgi:hypothetical protein